MQAIGLEVVGQATAATWGVGAGGVGSGLPSLETLLASLRPLPAPLVRLAALGALGALACFVPNCWRAFPPLPLRRFQAFEETFQELLPLLPLFSK